jgi:hypothetical protein
VSTKHFCDGCGDEIRGCQWWHGASWGDNDSDFCHDCYQARAHKHRQRLDVDGGQGSEQQTAVPSKHKKEELKAGDDVLEALGG